MRAARPGLHRPGDEAQPRCPARARAAPEPAASCPRLDPCWRRRARGVGLEVCEETFGRLLRSAVGGVELGEEAEEPVEGEEAAALGEA